jgi:hypothetical protein
LYRTPVWGCRILHAFEEWVTQVPYHPPRSSEREELVRNAMKALAWREEGKAVEYAFLEFLALPDTELRALYNIGPAAVRYLRKQTPHFRTYVTVYESSWDAWADEFTTRSTSGWRMA